MGKRRRAPHSKAAAAARNSRFLDHARQSVWHPPVGRKRPSGSLPFPGTTAHPRPVGTLWSAALCAAFHHVLPWPGRAARAGWGPACQAAVRMRRLSAGQTPRRCVSKSAGERMTQGRERRGRQGIGLSPSGRGERRLPFRAGPLPPSAGFPAVHPRRPQFTRSHDPQSAEAMGSTHLPEGPEFSPPPGTPDPSESGGGFGAPA